MKNEDADVRMADGMGWWGFSPGEVAAFGEYG